MSIQRFRDKTSANKKLNNISLAGTPWVRNPSWLPMPATTSSDEQVDLLVAIRPESNYFAIAFNTSAGTYNVDWGDGTNTNVSSGTTAQKVYTYTDAVFDGTNAPVTFTDSGDTVNRTAHGYTDGMSISFSSITTTTGIVPDQIYYVVNATANTFQVSASKGGGPLTLTTDGTGIILPYKLALVKIVPNTALATLTSINLQVKNTTTNLQAYEQPILDITISANVSSLTIGGPSIAPLRSLESCRILRHNTTTFSSLFNTCNSLQSVYIADSSAVTNMSSMFSTCNLLTNGPDLDTSAVTNMASMFGSCVSLVTVPLYNTSSVSQMSSMFTSCNSLVTIPLLNTSAATTMASMFSTCISLVTVPLLNTASVTDMSSMFQSCASLTSVPLFNTSAVANMTSMFNGCASLRTIPLLNTSAVTNMSSMFLNCSSLVSMPLLNTSAVIFMTSMFQSCVSLTSVPLFDTSAATNMASMFRSSTITSVPLFDTSAATTMLSMFQTCPALRTVPLFNTAAVTTFASMFNGSVNLKSVPAFDTTATTGTAAFTTMFNGCSSLAEVPAMNFGRTAITTTASYTNMFATCPALSRINCTVGPKFTFTVASAKLSAAALDALYTSLPTVTAQTITVTGNVGTAADTPSIATVKGWTVTGS